jgi:hypothetical protein
MSNHRLYPKNQRGVEIRLRSVVSESPASKAVGKEAEESQLSEATIYDEQWVTMTKLVQGSYEWILVGLEAHEQESELKLGVQKNTGGWLVKILHVI